MTRMFNGQIIFALALVALNTLYASQVLQMDIPFSTGEPGPIFLPSILCLFLYVAIFRIIYQEVRSGNKNYPNTIKTSRVIRYMQVVGPLIVIGLAMMFIALFFYVGYLVAAAAYTFFIAYFFNFEQTGAWKRSALSAAAMALGVTVFGWLLFVKLFGLYLPVWEF